MIRGLCTIAALSTWKNKSNFFIILSYDETKNKERKKQHTHTKKKQTQVEAFQTDPFGSVSHRLVSNPMISVRHISDHVIVDATNSAVGLCTRWYFDVILVKKFKLWTDFLKHFVFDHLSEHNTNNLKFWAWKYWVLRLKFERFIISLGLYENQEDFLTTSCAILFTVHLYPTVVL